jgi:hypothetical protein
MEKRALFLPLSSGEAKPSLPEDFYDPVTINDLALIAPGRTQLRRKEFPPARNLLTA